MIFECYACAQKSGMVPKMIHEDGEFRPGASWGICKVCGIVVCSGHGRRKQNPYEYQCTYCTGDFIERGGFLPEDPSDPIMPGGLDELLDAIGDLKLEIVTYVEKAVITYLRDNDKPLGSRLDEKALKVAAKAFRDVAEVPRQIAREIPARAGG